METRKIIFLLTTLSSGGGERVASDLTLSLPENIDKTIVLFKKEISYPYKGKIVSLDISAYGNAFKKAINCFLGLVKFRKLIKEGKPDYVISFGHLPNIINIFSGVKSIVRVDNFYSSSCQGFGGKIYKILVKLLFNRAYIIMPVSKESGSDLIKNFGIKEDKIKVIYNPLNIEEIDRLSKSPLSEAHEDIFKNPVIINIGQLGKQKNQKDIIEAFKIIKEKIKKAKLVILGQGPKEKDLRNLAEKLGLEKDIYFLGWQKNPFKFLANSKVFILSSLWEGLPCVLLEAMASGLPVISYDCKSGPREILAPETDSGFQAKNIEYAEYGVLTEPKNINQLAEVAVKLLSDKKMYLEYKENPRKRARHFNVENIIKEWDFLYETSN
ncbi:MAG: glycosyltransferase [Candidatus Staskawiczbacteria bacterium]|nr:glycosyltransferase [Candidatus Staskawiczbacteria bacterium]